MPNSPSETLNEIIHARRSCRAFRAEAVPRATLEALARMAQQSPSWCNVQPWELVITDGEATARLRSALAEHLVSPDVVPDLPFPFDYKDVYLERRRACGWALYESVGIKKGDREGAARQNQRNFSFFEAPHVAILTTTPELGVYGAVDCGVYLGHLLLGIESLGLGAIAQAAPALYSPFLHRHLGTNEDYRAVPLAAGVHLVIRRAGSRTVLAKRVGRAKTMVGTIFLGIRSSSRPAVREWRGPSEGAPSGAGDAPPRTREESAQLFGADS